MNFVLIFKCSSILIAIEGKSLKEINIILSIIGAREAYINEFFRVEIKALSSFIRVNIQNPWQSLALH